MRNATELMVQYAAYHRDRRNIAIHCVGIPFIVLAVGVLLGRSGLGVGAVTMTPAWMVWAAGALWYLTRGNTVLGLCVSALTAGLMLLGHLIAGQGATAWLFWGIGMFVAGWALQFAGHGYEGRKPAFLDDLTGLLVGPMFVTGEFLFHFGLCRPLRDEIERRAGPTRPPQA